MAGAAMSRQAEIRERLAPDYPGYCTAESRPDICWLLDRLDTLEATLRAIAEPSNPGNHSVCECEHGEDCCTLHDFYCPECIAGRALKESL